MKNLYVLLVGINDYPPPLPKLKGCLNDVDLIEKYLQEFCSRDFNLQIRQLKDADATYSNVLKGFREHLGSAGPDDVVWFHYSGHGTEEKTAPEFLTLEPNGKDQTLICYDSGKNGAPHLADKELAVLLYEITSKHGAHPPHVVVSLDCCHSGSGTRDIGEDMMWTSRAAPSSGQSRTLDSYAGGFYSNQSKLEVPSSKHLLLSACRSIQTAGDMPQGGAFTTGLIRALRSSKGNVNYNDLFIRARSAVQQVRDSQTPQFETILNFDPYTRFLEGSPTGERDLFEMIMLEGNWYARCGAINGLPTKLAAPIEVDIYSPPPEKELKGTGKITYVGAQLSKIEMDGTFGIGNFFRQMTDSNVMYFAAIRQLPLAPDVAKVTGDGSLTSLVKSSEPAPKHVVWAEGDEPSTLEVQAEPGGITVVDKLRGNKAFKSETSDKDGVRQVYDAMDKIVQWRRFIDLQNKNNASKVKDMFRFEMQEINEEGNKKKHAPGSLRIYADSKQLSNRLPAFMPVVHLNNVQQNLYFYLFFVAFDYSISCPGGEIIYRPNEHADVSHIEIPLWKKALGWGPAKDNVEDTCYFKLLVTTEALDYQQFLQNGLTAHRDILGEPTPEKVFDDWSTSMFAITMVRQDNTINANNDVSLAEGGVTIKAHPSINGSVSIGKVESNARSSDPVHVFSRLQGDGIGLVDFGSSRSLQSQQVIEINNIRLDDENTLQDNPLEITLQQGVSNDEVLIPIAFDGQHFRVIGEVDADENGAHVRIHEIPDTHASNGERSILKSLKMTFCKVALGQQEVNQLKWVDMDENGQPVLKKESLGIKLGKAKKVLLLLHGLGGDSLSMMKGLQANLPEANLKSYDLILAYDYESLNTPLSVTAAALKKTLTEYGFGTDDKRITIISHSLGGLVARWLIEQEGGNAYIDHCILVGAPNNGSLYGRIDAYRKWAQAACELAVNFVPSIVPFSGVLLKFFKAASDLGGSIAQIDPDSDFINRLNSSKDPGIKYTVISADAAALDQTAPGYNGFVQQAKERMSKWMNKDEPNDLFAPVRSLQCKELWEGRNPDNKIMDPITNHHFGYFISPEGSRDVKGMYTILSEVL